MKIDFQQGAYMARSASANAQQQINLFAEPNPPDSPHKVTLYPTPGLWLLADYTGSITGRCRGLYWSSGLQLYAVFGTSFGRINEDYTWHAIGSVSPDSTYPVSMADNGTYIFIVDGSTQGWTYNMLNGTFAAAVTGAGFAGSPRVDFIDTYFIFASANQPNWYISNSNAITFNPLYYVAKEGYSDLIVSIAALHDAIWVFGQVTTEIWFNAGAPDFPFQRMPQSVIQQGCFSSYSVVITDNAIYWLSQDRTGKLMMMRGEGYAAKRVSNFAVEQAWAQYNLTAGIVQSMTYQADGHEFVVIQFYNANQTWVYDATTGFWHQRQSGSGMWLPSAISYWRQGGAAWAGKADLAFAVAGDANVAKLYKLDRNTYTDNGQPITRLRSWPHAMNDQKRLSHNQFVAAMSGGVNLTPDQLSLSWSDDGGQTWGTPVNQTTNGASNGQYSWRRLGMARDRVYRLSWTATGETALSGAWLEATPADT